MNRIEVFIADDQRMMREGLSLLLDSQLDIQIVGEAFSRDAIQKGIKNLKPDILLLDTALIQTGEIQSISSLHKFAPETKVIMLSSPSCDEYVHCALNDGALGFISKQAPSSEITDAIHHVMHGHYFLSPSILNRVIETYLEGTRTKPRGRNTNRDKYFGFNQLSVREKEVFYLLLEGHSSREISQRLNISPKTADKHRTNIYKKTGIDNSTQLLHYALNLNLTRTSYAV